MGAGGVGRGRKGGGRGCGGKLSAWLKSVWGVRLWAGAQPPNRCGAAESGQPALDRSISEAYTTRDCMRLDSQGGRPWPRVGAAWSGSMQ